MSPHHWEPPRHRSPSTFWVLLGALVLAFHLCTFTSVRCRAVRMFSFLCIPQTHFLMGPALGAHGPQKIHERPAQSHQICLLRLPAGSSARLSGLPKVTQHVKRQHLDPQSWSSSPPPSTTSLLCQNMSPVSENPRCESTIAGWPTYHPCRQEKR